MESDGKGEEAIWSGPALLTEDTEEEEDITGLGILPGEQEVQATY